VVKTPTILGVCVPPYMKIFGKRVSGPKITVGSDKIT